MIQMNDVSLPSPSSLSVRIVPRAGSAHYNTLGQLVQDGVQQKRMVELIWSRMDASLLKQLSVPLSSKGFLHLSYPDPLSGNREMACRAVEQAARVFRLHPAGPLWADVKLLLEEQ